MRSFNWTYKKLQVARIVDQKVINEQWTNEEQEQEQERDDDDCGDDDDDRVMMTMIPTFLKE